MAENSVLEISRRINADRDAVRAYVPPISPDKMRETPKLMGHAVAMGTEKSLAREFLSGIGILPKAVGQGFTMTMEGIQRFEDVFQATVLTGVGRIKIRDYPGYVKRVVNGETELPGSEFVRLMIGNDLWNDIKDVTIIPGWAKRITTPDVHLGKTAKNPPLLTLGGVLGAATELLVSPFTIASFLPKSFFMAMKGPMLFKNARLGIDPATSVFTWPLRSAAHHMIGRDDGLGALLMRFRDPQSVLPPKLFELLYGNASKLEAKGEDVVEALSTVSKRYNLNRDENAGLWRHLFDSDQALNQRQTDVLNEIKQSVIQPLYMDMKASRLHGYRYVDKAGNIRRQHWDPDKDLLRVFVGDVRQFKHVPIERGAPGMYAQSHVQSPWRFSVKNGVPKDNIPYDFKKLADNQLDVFMALESWAARNWRRTVLEEVSWIKGSRVNRGFAAVTRSGEKALKQRWGSYKAGVDARLANISDPIERELLGELSALGPARYRYLQGKMRDITGHRAGSMEIAFDNVMDRMFGNVEKMFDSLAQRSRIVAYFQRKAGGRVGAYGQPGMTRISALTGYLTQNIVIAALGANLGSAFRNTSQLLNTAAKEGVPDTIKGIFRLNGSGVLGATLKTARKEARFIAAFNRAHYNPDAWALGKASLLHKIMIPFNSTENLMRGIAGNIAGERWLAKFGRGRLFHQLSPREQEALVRFMRLEAADTNFIYGVAGRSHLMMNPVLRLGTTLQSYSWKQAEFIARMFATEGGAAVRLWGLNGMVMDLMDRGAGINPEQWIGWGFVPPNAGARVGSPFVQHAVSWLGAMSAAGRDDFETYDAEMRNLGGAMSGVFRELGFDGPEGPAIMNSIAMSGIMPFPVLAAAKSVRAIRGFMSGSLESQSGRTWIPVTRAEAIKSAFFTLHSQAEDARLRAMDRKLRGVVDRTMDHRVSKVVNALRGNSGDDVITAVSELYQPIRVGLPLSGVSPVPWGFLGDDRQFMPHPEMYERRLNNMLARRMLSGPLADMLRSGWTFEVLWAEYTKRAFDLIERGAIRGLQ